MKSVEIYTDGACSGNPGTGGWAAILMYNGAEKEISGYAKETTNNRMELFAAVQGLRALRESCRVTLYSDSSYMVKAFNEGWIDGWLKRGWKAAGGGDVKNQDLWKALIYEVNKHEVTFVWVKGHDESEFNNRCDRLAVEAIKQCRNNNGTEE